MPVLEATAAIASIIAGIVTCSKYAKDIHDKHREKQTVASEALRLHGILQTSEAEISGQRQQLRRHVEGQSRPRTNPVRRDVFLLIGVVQLMQAQAAIAQLEVHLRTLYCRPTSQLSDSDLTPMRSLAQDSHNLIVRVLKELNDEQNGKPTNAGQIALDHEPASVSSLMRFLTPDNRCKSADEYRGNIKQLHEVAQPVVGDAHDAWMCKRCKTIVLRVTAPLYGCAGSSLSITVEGMFKAHGKEGWHCIWPQTHSSCYRGPLANEEDFAKHMKTHHTQLHADRARCKIQRPADERRDFYGLGATIGGQQLGESSFY